MSSWALRNINEIKELEQTINSWPGRPMTRNNPFSALLGDSPLVPEKWSGATRSHSLEDEPSVAEWASTLGLQSPEAIEAARKKQRVRDIERAEWQRHHARLFWKREKPKVVAAMTPKPKPSAAKAEAIIRRAVMGAEIDREIAEIDQTLGEGSSESSPIVEILPQEDGGFVYRVDQKFYLWTPDGSVSYSKVLKPHSNAHIFGAQEQAIMAEWTGLEPATPGVTGRSMK